jgi:hypothetical protein
VLYLNTFQQKAPAALLLSPLFPFVSLGHMFSYLAVIPILVGDKNAQISSLVSYCKIPFMLVFLLDIGIHVFVVGEQICFGDFVIVPTAREYFFLV